MSISQDFEARRRERLKKQRQQRRRLKALQLLLSVVLFILVMVIIVTSISKCKGNSTPEIDNSVPITTSVPYDSAQTDVQNNTDNNEQTPKYEIPSPTKGKNDILGVIKDSGQKKHVYLTFNNGPDNKVTPQILDILRRYNIKATFFMVGENIEKSPQVCARVIQEGHLAAPLSYSDDFRATLSSKSDFIEGIAKTYELINQNASSSTESFKIARFPGGSFDESGYGFNKESYKNELAEEGFYFADWNCTIGDSASQKNADNLLAYFTQNRPQLNNLVILMHDSSANQATADMLERLVKQLSDEGYIFSRLDEIDFINPPEESEISSEQTDNETQSATQKSVSATQKPETTNTTAEPKKTEKPKKTEEPKKTQEPKKTEEPKKTAEPKKTTTPSATEKPVTSVSPTAPPTAAPSSVATVVPESTAPQTSDASATVQPATQAPVSVATPIPTQANTDTKKQEKILDTE